VRAERRREREQAIHAAAYALVAERGYGSTSMLAVAKEANASNETLYRWYGDKSGLFRSMVDANAAATRDALASAVAGNSAPVQALRAVAPVLLAMVLGEKAIALNRAAAADPTGELGEAIAQGGRDTVLPMVVDLVDRAIAEGVLKAGPAGEAAEWFLALLIGDQQIRRVIGRMPEPTVADVSRRAQAACDAFVRLCAP